MYSFARTPRWLAGHALAGVLLVIFVAAGFWQLSRHGQQRDRNAVITERQDMRALDADSFFEAVSDPGLRAELEYRLVSLPVARVDWREAVQIRNRSLDGHAGCHVAIPVGVPSDKGAEPRGVLTIAGWSFQKACAAVLAGEVVSYWSVLGGASQIDGRIRLSQERGLLGPSDPAQGRLGSMARTDVERIDQQTTLDLVPIYVELESAKTADGSSIVPSASEAGTSSVLVALPPPELDAGPHLGYTFQWFSFAAVAIVGYTLVLRHQARKGDSEQIADD